MDARASSGRGGGGSLARGPHGAAPGDGRPQQNRPTDGGMKRRLLPGEMADCSGLLWISRVVPAPPARGRGVMTAGPAPPPPCPPSRCVGGEGGRCGCGGSSVPVGDAMRPPPSVALQWPHPPAGALTTFVVVLRFGGGRCGRAFMCVAVGPVGCGGGACCRARGGAAAVDRPTSEVGGGRQHRRFHRRLRPPPPPRRSCGRCPRPCHSCGLVAS